MTDRPRLHIIHGTPPPQTEAEKVRERVRKAPKPPEMIQCHRCGGREITSTLVGAALKGGKVTGGTKQWLCTICLLKGERVVLA